MPMNSLFFISAVATLKFQDNLIDPLTLFNPAMGYSRGIIPHIRNNLDHYMITGFKSQILISLKK